MIPALTIPRLMRAMPHAGVERVSAWVGSIEQALYAHSINTTERAAMFLAQFAHESRELIALSENLRYSAPRLRAVFPHDFLDDATAERYAAAGPVAIANRVYSDRMGNGPEASGDGWRFRGRAAGITFRDNYRACSSAVCSDANNSSSTPSSSSGRSMARPRPPGCGPPMVATPTRMRSISMARVTSGTSATKPLGSETAMDSPIASRTSTPSCASSHEHLSR
jgi:putative chitinase